MNKENRKGSRLPVIVLCSVLSVVTQHALAKGDFACHVVLETGQSEVFLVQTKQEPARVVAARGSVTVDGGRKARVVEVVECIRADKGRFSDSTMREYYKDMPL